jgi:predicted  nucleic acid-binding Zn-ribbon protein
MKKYLLRMCLLLVGTLTASEEPKNSVLIHEIFVTKARLQILNDAAVRITHMQEKIIEKQSRLTQSHNAVVTASQNLEIASDDLVTKLQKKKQEIRATEALLAQLLQQEQANKNHRRNSWN